MENQAIANLRNYLKIRSVHPNVDYSECVEFLLSQAEEIGLESQVIELVPKKPIVVITLLGEQPELPSILLNSHMDVVPVFEEFWTHKPFDAYYDVENGRIYGRGTQDMKSIGIQYLEALRLIKNEDVKLNRTVHVSFVPDEEIGGVDGVMKWVYDKSFKDLNIDFVLEEGMPSKNETLLLCYAERTIWRVKVNCYGETGHGSMLVKNTAGEKLRCVLNHFMDYRKTQEDKLSPPVKSLGDVTSVNLTKIEGGKQGNVLPPVLSATFDVRITLNDQLEDIEKMFNDFCQISGDNIEIVYEQKENYRCCTHLEDNIWWNILKKSCEDLNIEIKPEIMPATTDSRFFREVGLPVFGISSLYNTQPLAHHHDEYVDVEVFLKGIEIYKKFIMDLTNSSIPSKNY